MIVRPFDPRIHRQEADLADTQQAWPGEETGSKEKEMSDEMSDEIRKRFWVLALMACCAAGRLAAQEVLTLDEAVNIALDRNRSIGKSVLEASEYDDQIAAARTQRWVKFQFTSTTGIMLTKPTLTFARGAFGEYPGLGPIPSTNTAVSSPRKATAILSSEAALPLTQQYRIGLGLRQLHLQKSIAVEQSRATRQSVVKQVRQAYYSILQSQSSLDAVEHNLALLRELASHTTHYVKTGGALAKDLLEVQSRLAQELYEREALRGPLETQREQLNSLLGRPIDTPLRVSPAIEASWIPDLNGAREQALERRPELRQARLKVDVAEVERKKKRSEFIPDVSLSVSYASALNMSTVMPKNLAIAGLHTSFEPFDWGRKRSEIAQKQKQIERARLEQRELEDRVRIEVGSAHRKMREAEALLSASRAAQENAREAVRVTAARYRLDAGLVRDVLDSQSGLAQANDRTQKAMLAYWSARAEFELSTAEETGSQIGEKQ